MRDFVSGKNEWEGMISQDSLGSAWIYTFSGSMEQTNRMKALCPQCPSPLRLTPCKPLALASPEQAAGTCPMCDLAKEPRLPIVPTSLKEF